MSTTNSTTEAIEAMTPQAAREAAGLDKAQLAELIPCALTTVYNAENANRWPRAKALRKAYIASIARAMRRKAGQP